MTSPSGIGATRHATCRGEEPHRENGTKSYGNGFSARIAKQGTAFGRHILAGDERAQEPSLWIRRVVSWVCEARDYVCEIRGGSPIQRSLVAGGRLLRTAYAPMDLFFIRKSKDGLRSDHDYMRSPLFKGGLIPSRDLKHLARAGSGLSWPTVDRHKKFSVQEGCSEGSSHIERCYADRYFCFSAPLTQFVQFAG